MEIFDYCNLLTTKFSPMKKKDFQKVMGEIKQITKKFDTKIIVADSENPGSTKELKFE